MKKILSVLLAVAMLVGMIVPSLTVAAAGDALVVASPDAEVIATGGTEFTSKVSITDNPGDLVYFQLLVWWEADSDVADFDVAYDEALFSANSGITAGPLAGNNRNMKGNAGAFGVATADYQCVVVDFEVEADAIEATEMDLVDLIFSFDAPLAAGNTFTYGCGVLYACDSNDEDLVWDEEGFVCTTTFVADPEFAALAEEYAGQVLTIAATDVEFNKDTDEKAEIKLYMLNNDENADGMYEITEGKYAGKYLGRGVWGMTLVLVYDQALSVGEAQNGFLFEDSALNIGDLDCDENNATAVGAAKFAFQSFNFDIKDSGKRFHIISIIPDDDSKDYFGNGLICTVPFTVPANARVGATYTINVMSDLEDGVSNSDNVSIPFQCADGSIKVTGTDTGCDHETTHDVVKTDPTCTEPGVKDVVCDVCEEIVEADVEIPALGHTPAAMAEVAATCTEAGSTGGSYCSVCEAVLEEATVVPATGHTPGDWEVVTPATTSAAGLEQQKCAVCEEVINEREIPQILEAVVAAADVEVLEGAAIAVPVTIENNNGFWAIGATITSELAFAGITDGMLTIGDDNVSYADGVVTVFVDNAELADIEGDGTLFTVNYVATRIAGEYDVDVEVFDFINVAGEDVEFLAEDGVVKVNACDHANTTAVVAVDPTATSEGTLAYYCDACGAVVKTEVIPMLTSIVVGEAVGYKDQTVEIPVSFANNNGVWSLGMTIAYDDEALEFVGADSGLFAIGEDNISVADGVITVFADNAALADITEDGAAFTLTFKILTYTDGEYALTAAVNDDLTINAASEFVSVTPFDGKVTVPMLTKATVGEAEGKINDVVEIPVTLADNAGLWAIGMTVAYDAEALEFVGIEGGLFPAGADTAGAADGVVTIFADAAGFENITEDGTAFTLSFKVLTATAGEYALTAAIIADNTIDADAENVVVLPFDGKVVVLACDHANTELQGAAVATCVAEGYTGDLVCLDCGAVVEAGTAIAIDPANHVGEEVIATEAITATCVTEGFTASYKCSACEAIVVAAESLGFDADNHEGEQVIADEAITATCCTEGFTASYKCSACGEIVVAAESLGFDEDNHEGEAVWVTITEPTADEDGLKQLTYTCCGKVIDEEVIPAVVFITKVSATEKVKAVTLEGKTITVYARNFADYVKFAIGKQGAKVVGSENAVIGNAANPTFSYVTVNAPDTNATITLRDENGNEATYDIVVVYSDGGVEGGSKMLACQIDGTDVTVTAPANCDYASFRFVFDVVGYSFVSIDEGVDTVVANGITWFKVYNDGSNHVVKNVTVADTKGVETTYTITADFVAAE